MVVVGVVEVVVRVVVVVVLDLSVLDVLFLDLVVLGIPFVLLFVLLSVPWLWQDLPSQRETKARTVLCSLNCKNGH